LSKSYKFKTPKDSNIANQTINIAIGGRNPNNAETFKMHYILNKVDIDIALISGYLVFDYG